MDLRAKNNALGATSPVDSGPIVQLMQFLCENKWQNEGQLQAVDFPGTGRGIRTARNRDFEPDETLIDMPFRSIFISLITLMEDKGFRTHCVDKLAKDSGTVSTQVILTVYVLYQRHLGDKSKWKAYIETLPKSLSTPHFCQHVELDCVPMIRGLVSKSVQGLSDAFNSAFSPCSCECCGQKLVDLISPDELLLMFYLVNSRSVYCSPGIIRGHCLDLITLSDEPNMALAPFLDLFNHSDAVETESSLCEDKQGELRYQLVTKTGMSCTTQLFINYGNHDNFKLLMEYGFIIEGNRFEKIDLSLGQVEDFMRGFPKYHHAKKLAFIRDHGMHSEVFVSAEGLSYNLEMIFKIFRSAGLSEKSLSEVVYQQSTVPMDESVNLKGELYSYLISRFERAEAALSGIEQLTDSGRMLLGFFRGRIRLLSRLREEIMKGV